MRIEAQFVVESGMQTLIVGKVVHMDATQQSDLRYWDWVFQTMSREISRDMIRNTTMLAHLVTHPDDMPISCDDSD